MAIICWGGLGKAANDSTTIDEEITEYIRLHDENLNAHMGEDYSLGVHRLQTVIDHAPYSILNRFTYPQVRNYKAIVDLAGYGDLTDIQAALDYVNSLGGGSILVKPGTYTLSADLDLYNNIEVVGEDKTDTIIDFDGGNFKVDFVSKTDAIFRNFTIKNSGVYSVNLNNAVACRLLDINFDGNDSDVRLWGNSKRCEVNRIYSINSVTESLRVLTTFSDANINSISHYKINGGDGRGVLFDGGYRQQLFQITASNLTGDGFKIDSLHTDRSSLLSCVAFQNGGDGFNIDTADRISLIGCQGNDNGGDGFNIDTVGDSIFEGCHAMDNGAYGVILSANSANNIVLGNLARWNTTDQIVDNGVGNQVAHNLP